MRSHRADRAVARLRGFSCGRRGSARIEAPACGRRLIRDHASHF